MEAVDKPPQVWCANRGLSQEIVCEGICETVTLSRLENGRQTMAYNRVKALMQRLNMPDDRFYALLSKQETELDNTRKELSACVNRFACAQGEQKRQMRELALEQLHRLESLAEEADTITQQDILRYKVLFGHEQGPYSQEECLNLLLCALRLTVPNFNLDKLGIRRYSMQETQILNQIAGAYSRSGDHPQAPCGSAASVDAHMARARIPVMSFFRIKRDLFEILAESFCIQYYTTLLSL